MNEQVQSVVGLLKERNIELLRPYGLKQRIWQKL